MLHEETLPRLQWGHTNEMDGKLCHPELWLCPVFWSSAAAALASLISTWKAKHVPIQFAYASCGLATVRVTPSIPLHHAVTEPPWIQAPV